ncbi:MAG: CmcJ/NvfI family oxidoreductase [Gammaproteobacteria bacterium]
MHSSASTSVEATFNYLADDETAPAYYLYETAPGHTPPPPGVRKVTCEVVDLRPTVTEFSLDRHGFAFAEQPLPALDYLDDAVVRECYYPCCVDLVRAMTGAAHVLAFDHNVRDKALSREPGSTIREPVRFVHNDYTEDSAPQRVRDLLGDAADAALQGRYVFINVWRPLRGPVEDQPFAICDAGSLHATDFVATALCYTDRRGEIYTVRPRARHRWYYLGRMQSSEIMLLKCFDSARDGRARYTAHSAFHHPAPAADVPTRRSLEVRTLACFAA